MKKTICALALCICSLLSTAFAETNYVNITSLRLAAPERLQGEFLTQTGNAIRIDAPIIIPDVSAVPIVRVTWGGPMEIADASLQITANNANLLQIDHGFMADANRILTDAFETVNTELPHTAAAEALLNRICSAMPTANAQDFECINALSYRHGNSTGGFYMMFFARLYHGIPYLCNAPYAISLGNTEPAIPNEVTHGCIENEEQYTFSLSSPKELEIVETDVPLLPFSEIEKIIAQRIESGYVKSLNEIRFGYRIFVDPDHPGTEYILTPVWMFSGTMRAALDIPFVDEEVVFMPYKNMSSFAINAQTGEVYTFAFETSKDRQAAPQILTWNELN
ncbi:MAG: hypothetical protein IJA59_04080 [Clostridia bacterium]|nr:hypothetical protein [Clostridia bacterium]